MLIVIPNDFESKLFQINHFMTCFNINYLFKDIKNMNNNEKLVGMRLYLVMIGMLLTGTANTILTKW